jgi:2-dehydro-3-deoxyphosphogalactonate aldolase
MDKLVIVSNTNTNVIKGALRNKLIPVIGCMTPTESLIAIKTGAQTIKISPAAHIGATGGGLGSNLYKVGRSADEIHTIATETDTEWKRISV